MSSLICLYSYHHKNTAKIAQAMATVIDAEIKMPQELSPEEIARYDLVGFGAGINSGKHYKPLLDFASRLPQMHGKRAFMFSTAGVSSEKKITKDHKALREILTDKGYTIVGEFGCKGFNTNSVLKLIGGINRGRPNEEDIQDAKVFARQLWQRAQRTQAREQ